jgi:hypothetical protein
MAKVNSAEGSGKSAENKPDPNDKNGDGKIDKKEFEAMPPEQQDQYEGPDKDGFYKKKEA